MNILQCLSFKYWLVAVVIFGAFSCEPQPPAVKSKALIIHKEIAPSALKYNKITYTINFVSKEDTLTKTFFVDMVNGSGRYKIGDSILVYHRQAENFEVEKTELYSSFRWNRNLKVE